MTDPTPTTPRPWILDALLGVGAAVLAIPIGLIGVAAGGWLLGGTEFAAIFTLAAAMVVGVTQGLWVLPMAVLAWRAGRSAFLQGLLGTAALVFMLNASCYAVLLGTLRIAG